MVCEGWEELFAGQQSDVRAVETVVGNRNGFGVGVDGERICPSCCPYGVGWEVSWVEVDGLHPMRGGDEEDGSASGGCGG